MAYKYYITGSPVFFQSPKETLTSEFYAWQADQFYNATDYHIVKEESIFASGSLVDIGARINKAISSVTGVKLGDDFKQLLFSGSHVTGIGYKYYFDQNYWLVTQSEMIRSLGSTCTVRRCNNNIRWMDTDGNIYTEPCIIEYEIKRPTDGVGAKDPVTPEGFIQVYVQGNDKTRLISTSQRFLFGNSHNRVGYKIYGNGLNNFINQETSDDESANLIWFYMGVGYVSEETDDIANGIADRYNFDYGLSFLPTSISGSIGTNIQIYPTVTLNDVVVDKTVIYSTSASSIATVSGSGLVTLIATGSCNITGYVQNNISASAILIATVSGSTATPNEIRIDPNPDFILQGDTVIYTSYLYINGNIQADTFSFTIGNNNVPVSNYIFTIINGNSFSIKNVKVFMDDPLVINCVSGSNTKQLSIMLKGSW